VFANAAAVARASGTLAARDGAPGTRAATLTTWAKVGRASGTSAATKADATSAASATRAWIGRTLTSASDATWKRNNGYHNQRAGGSAGGVGDGNGGAAAAGNAETGNASPGDGKDKNILDNLLKTHNIVQTLEALEDIGTTQDTMSLGELEVFLRDQVSPPRSAEETATRIKLLEECGAVLILEDMVYLHPRDVTTAVLRVLPGVPSKVYGVTDADLQAMTAEFETMKERYQIAQRRAESRSRTIVSSGLILLCLQLATFVRLTYYEFSWDVMEPLSYFVGLGNAIMVYVYYLWNRRDFSFETWHKSLMGTYAASDLKRSGFDLERYTALSKRLRRAARA
jgi:hypothetical protein